MKIAKLLIALLAMAAPLLAAQTAPQAPTRVPNDYIIGAMDQLALAVNSPVAQPEFSGKTYVVQADGTIQLPMVAKPVKVGDLTVSGAQQAIRQALIDSNQYQDPIVTVTVTEARNSSVTVQGAVRSPGNIALRADRMTISDAIANAGGFQPSAGARIWIRGGPKRPQPDVAAGAVVDENGEVFRRMDVLQGKVADPRVFDGDTILVEAAPHFYVTGYVKSSQSEYNWEPNLTLNTAIAMAGGPSPEGALNRVTITRKDPKTGKFVKAKLSKDPLATIIEANDVINVPKKRM